MNFVKKLILSTLTVLIFYSTPTRAEIIDGVLAHIGNKIITEYDIQNLDPRKYREILAIKNEAYRKEALETFTKSALDYLINQEIIVIAASRENISVSEKEIDAAVNEITARGNISISQLEEFLAKEGTSMAKYRYQIRNDILNARVRSNVLMPKIIVTERDIREIADSMPDEYHAQNKYEIYTLITSDKASMDKALKAIGAGLSFEDAVKKYSIDKTALNGGYMGWMEAGSMSGEMLKSVEKTKKGELSEPFEMNSQWIICKVNDFTEKYKFDEETRKKLIEAASEKLFSKTFNEWLERHKSTIVVLRKGEKGSALR